MLFDISPYGLIDNMLSLTPVNRNQTRDNPVSNTVMTHFDDAFEFFGIQWVNVHKVGWIFKTGMSPGLSGLTDLLGARGNVAVR